MAMLFHACICIHTHTQKHTGSAQRYMQILPCAWNKVQEKVTAQINILECSIKIDDIQSKYVGSS